jgi:hypothetical protein
VIPFNLLFHLDYMYIVDQTPGDTMVGLCSPFFIYEAP